MGTIMIDQIMGVMIEEWVNVIHRQAARYRHAALHGNHWKIKCIYFLSK